jgi:hypothetical protein
MEYTRMMPPLPKPDAYNESDYTEAQLIAYGRQCVEAAVNLYSPDDTATDYFDKVYDMFEGED